MIEPTAQLKASLKQHGYSLTRARQVVFEALLGHEPQTMHGLVSSCGGQVDRASVYRNMSLYEKLGVVQRLHVGWKYQFELSDAFSQHHHHLTCSRCGLIVPLSEDQILEDRLRELAHRLKFQPESHQIEMRGLCQKCVRTEAAPLER